MEFVEKEINEQLNRELEATESNRIEDFRIKSTKRFFATISGFIDKQFFVDKTTKHYDEAGHKRYCERATTQLQNELKRFGLEYQKILGAWEGGEEKSFLVWNTAYTFEQFQAIMLKLNENFKQWAICIGKWVDDKYAIDLWSTDDLDNISYKIIKQFTKVSPKEAIHDNWTILTRHQRKGKEEPAIAFESLEMNSCLAASWSQWGAYKRGELLKELLGHK